ETIVAGSGPGRNTIDGTSPTQRPICDVCWPRITWLDGEASMTAARQLTGRLATGAAWAIDVPEGWNGTLCLFSHGYGELGPDEAPDNAGDPVTKETLLRLGYALAGSTFSTPGWAVAESIPDQVAVVEEFRRLVGTPEVVVAWGRSMGGLITAALAQEAPDAIDVAVPMCASVAGPIPMLNQGLDAAF